MALARKNGLKPDKALTRAIVKASRWYNINPLDLTAIGILETRLGTANTYNINKNGTIDKGIFQINTVNQGECQSIGYNLDTSEGSAMCAARILWKIRHKYSYDKTWPAMYHSRTPKYKEIYLEKLNQVLAREK